MRVKQIVRGCLVCALICCMTAGTSGCGNEDVKGVKDEIKEYRLSALSAWFLGKAEYQDAVDYALYGDKDSVEISGEYASKAYRDGDHIILEATDKQRDALVEQNRKLMEQAIDDIKTYDEFVVSAVEYDAEQSSVAFYLSIDDFKKTFSKPGIKFTGNMMGIVSIALADRILLTGDCNAAVYVDVINSESGHKITSAIFPYESVDISEKDFTVSKNKDVAWPSDKQGYSYMKATAAEVNERQIMFEPAEGGELYKDDGLLCLCLDSVYADEVELPYGFEDGDEVYLIVDGLYAIHEDGDDIPDIAPLAMIPAEYMKEKL